MNTSETVKSEHTPTPWELREPGKHSKDKFRVVRVHGTSVTGHEIAGAVCEICTQRSSKDGFTDAEERANAHFIVTACNAHDVLLSACRVALDWIEGYPEGKFYGPVKELKDAISLATNT